MGMQNVVTDLFRCAESSRANPAAGFLHLYTQEKFGELYLFSRLLKITVKVLFSKDFRKVPKMFRNLLLKFLGLPKVGSGRAQPNRTPDRTPFKENRPLTATISSERTDPSFKGLSAKSESTK
jgi:hypothetical protein